MRSTRAIRSCWWRSRRSTRTPAARTTRSTSTTFAPTSPRCSSGTASRWTRPAPTPSPRAAARVSARRGRTSTTCCDAGTFVEHGQLVLTPGTGLPREEVIRRFPTDGMITGIGAVNGYTVPAARRPLRRHGLRLHRARRHPGRCQPPEDRPHAEVAEKLRRPVVLFAEGGGGRAGTGGKRDGGAATSSAGQGRSDDAYRPLDTPTFSAMARLSGLVPLVGVTSRLLLRRERRRCSAAAT